CAHAPRGTELPAGGVEHREAGIGRGPPGERVEGTAVAVLARARLPAVVAVRVVPDALGLEGEHARAADLAAEQPAGGEREVVYYLGLNAEARSAGQQPVVGIVLPKRGRHVRRLPIGRREDDEPVDRLQMSALLEELCGQPIEQLGVARPLALGAEILARLDEPV